MLGLPIIFRLPLLLMTRLLTDCWSLTRKQNPMSERLRHTTAICITVLVLVSGCHPTQPFYFENDGDLSHYLNAATQVEFADLDVEPSAEATGAIEPHHLRNLQLNNFWDISLEEAIAMALHNSKVIRSAAMFQQFGFASTGASRVAQAPTIYGPALSETLTSPTGLQVDSNGNRVLSRGAARANTVGGYADALAEFDAQLFSSLSYSTTDRPRNVGPGNVFNPVISQGHDGNFLVALSKRTATGGVWTARQTMVYSENNTAIGVGRAVPSDWTAAFELEMSHPLLQGAGPQVNRLPIILARIRTDIAVADFEGRVRDLIKDVEDAYWDLHCAYRIVEANKQGRDAALAAWRIDKVRAGKKDPGAQLPRSRGQAYRFQARYEASLAANTQGEGLLPLERKLRGLMGIVSTDERGVLRPVDEPTSAYTQFEYREVLMESLARSPELRQKKWALKQAQQEMISARNLLLPELNLGLRHRVVGVGDDLINANRRGANFEDTPIGSLAFDNLFEGNFTESTVTMTFQPNAFGSRRAQARIQAATLKIRNEEALLEQMENVVEHELSNAYADLNNQYKLAQLAYSQWMAAESEVNMTEALKESEERVHDRMLDAHDRRATARIEYFQRLCDYNKAIAGVHYMKGSLLEYNSVSLAEGPWPQKAYWDALGRARERDASYYFNYGSTRPAVVSQGAVPQGASAAHNMAPVDVAYPASNGPSESFESFESNPSFEEFGPGMAAPTIDSGASVPATSAVQQASHSEPAEPSEPGFQWGSLGLPANQ